MHQESLTPTVHDRGALAAVETPNADLVATGSTTSPSSTANARRQDRIFTPPQAMQLLRIDDVCQLLRISKPTFWRLRRRTDFPESTAVTERVMAWSGRDIQAWIERRRLPLRR